MFDWDKIHRITHPRITYFSKKLYVRVLKRAGVEQDVLCSA